jgi:hypothetical protein
VVRTGLFHDDLSIALKDFCRHSLRSEHPEIRTLVSRKTRSLGFGTVAFSYYLPPYPPSGFL